MRTTIRHFIEPENGRPGVHKLSELRDVVDDAAGIVDALCFLLRECSGSKIEAGLILNLLEPAQRQMTLVANDMADMRL